MRFLYIILLCGVIIESVSITNANTTSKSSDPGDSATTIATSRFLRIYDKDDDERAFGIKSIPGVDKVSKYLYNQKLERTRKKNDKYVYTVFSKLGLNKAGEKLFEDPKFVVWTQSVDNYNNKNNKQVSILPTLQSKYDDEVLIKMLEAATQVESTKHVATILQVEQMTIWNRKGLSVDDLFLRFKLDLKLNPLNNPAINILGRYSEKFNPGKSTLLKTLQKRYSDVKLSQMLEQASQVKTTKVLATKLQSEQMEAWKSAGLSTDELFKIYKLDDGVNPLASPVLFSWLKYADKLNPGKKTTLLDTLRGHYKDSDLSQLLIAARKVPSTQKHARILEDQLLSKWLDDLIPLDEVFKILKLDKGADNLLDSMQLKTWRRYENMFEFKTRNNPFVQQATLAEMLMGHYNAKDLEKLFNSATTLYGQELAKAVRAELATKSLI